MVAVCYVILVYKGIFPIPAQLTKSHRREFVARSLERVRHRKDGKEQCFLLLSPQTKSNRYQRWRLVGILMLVASKAKGPPLARKTAIQGNFGFKGQGLFYLLLRSQGSGLRVKKQW